MCATQQTQRLVVLGPNLSGAKTTFIVHAEGCADLNRGPHRMQVNDHFHVEAASQTEVCDITYPPGDFDCESGDYLFDFHFAPCVKLPERA